MDSTPIPAEREDITDLRALSRRLAEAPSLRGLAEALRAGHSGTIEGTWGSSRALSLAALDRFDPALLVIVLPHPSDVEAMVDDLRSFGRRGAAVLPALDQFAGDPSEEDSLIRRGTRTSSDPNFGRRMALLKTLRTQDPPRVVVTTIQALMQPLPTYETIGKHSRMLRRGKPTPLDDLLAWMEAHGWQRTEAVVAAGEYSLRGGILDVYPTDALDPLRIEFFGDEVESIRLFSVETQRSLREIEQVEITALGILGATETDVREVREQDWMSLVPAGTWFALVEPFELQREAKRFRDRFEEDANLLSPEDCWTHMVRHPSVVLSNLPHPSVEMTCSLAVESVERFSGEITKVREELDRVAQSDQVLIVCHNEAEQQRLEEVFRESRSASEGQLRYTIGHLSAGFRWVSEGLVVLSDHELFHRTEVHRAAPRRRHQSRAIDSFLDLVEGDYVVHLGHGIAKFRGMKMLDKNGQWEEHLTLEFSDQTLVYVPASKIDLVQKYVGSSQAPPRLSKIGGVSWERRKKQVERAVLDLASDMVDLQAARQNQPGTAFPDDSTWQQEFEAAFPFTETHDQLVARDEILGDMQLTRPMDRLLCGDVGYGKTELAMRAAFKAVDFGKQVAVLVPTTVLAQQHLRSFRQRMAEFPFNIEGISRFQTRGEQNAILKKTKEGQVDILIGTHRLLSADVGFADLGLVVVDEEQRFGVQHKERLKQLRAQVDVLTLSATPIPRTLHSALLGIRDISNLETPPQERMAVETRVCRWDPTLLRHAILREINRDGQIYFVHNRIQDIRQVEQELLKIVPELRIAILHGQMDEESVEAGMLAFLERRVDLLLATTIIESGLDIPNANTIFIHDGDRYGLADLHQLRGRVGRSRQRAYCYVIIDERKVMTPDAQRRLKAIEEYSALGSGFKIALRDLEIRGAGNLLGAEQSGHIAAVGYELYCQLLDNAVRSINKKPLRTYLDVTVELPWQAYLPPEYLPGERMRIDAYRRLTRVEDFDTLHEIERELEDRYGPLPPVARNFLDLVELRALARIWQVATVRTDEDGNLLLGYRDRRRVATLEKLRQGRVRIVDPKTAYVRVEPRERNAAGYCALLKQVLNPS